MRFTMNQREKLKDLLISADISTFGKPDSWVDIFADYLLKNGVFVLPCKVGDPVFRIGYTPCIHGRTHYSKLCQLLGYK